MRYYLGQCPKMTRGLSLHRPGWCVQLLFVPAPNTPGSKYNALLHDSRNDQSDTNTTLLAPSAGYRSVPG